MQGSSHHICSQVKLSADYNGSESEAHFFMKELPHMVNSALSYVSDELDGLPGLKSRSIRFRRLSIDIGLIDERYFKDDFRNRLKNALLEKIDQVAMNSGMPDPDVESVDADSVPGRLIRHLLCYGTAPWWADRSRELRLRYLLREFISESPDLFTGLMWEVGHLPPARQRLIQQLDQSTLLSVVKLMEPVEAAFIDRFIELLIKFAKYSGTRDSRSHLKAWDVVLEYLVRQKSRPFSRTDFVEKVMKKFSTESDFRKGSFTHFVKSIKDPVVNDELIQVLKENSLKPSKSVKEENLQPTDEWTFLKDILLEDNPGSDSSVRADVSKWWNRLFETGEQSVFIKIKSLAGDPLVRRNLSIFLPDENLLTIVRLAEPANASFILDQSRRIVKIQESIPDLQIPKAELKVKSWEFILTYLFEDKGSQFNRKQFLRSTLEQFAAHYNLKYTSLLRYLIVFTSDEQTGSSIAVHSLLRDLEQDEQNTIGVKEEPPLWLAPERLKRITEAARLMTFTGVSRAAEEFYLFAKHDPEKLSQILKTDKFSEDGLIYIWSFLSRSQKGIVLMAVSPSKIRDWEQIVSQIETLASESKGIRRSVDLDSVFDLVFRHGVLNESDMETLLSLYLEELARENRSTKRQILEELERKHDDDDDRLLVRYLKLQPKHDDKNYSGHTDEFNRFSKSPSDPLLSRIDRLFQSPDPEHSKTTLNLFKSLKENELRRAIVYISSKRGWNRLAETVTAEHWKEWVRVLLKGELPDDTLAVHDLFRQMYQANSTGKNRPEKLQKLQGMMMDILMRNSKDMNSRRLVEQLFRLEAPPAILTLTPEAVRQIQSSISSAQTPYFNLLMELQKVSPNTTNRDKTGSPLAESQDVARVLELLNKLTLKEPDTDDLLVFPLLMRQLKTGEPSIRGAIVKSVRNPATVGSWAKNLPSPVLSKLTKSLISDRLLNMAKHVLDDVSSVLMKMLPYVNQERFEAILLFKYAARYRYQDYTPGEFLKTVLVEVSDMLPASGREKKVMAIKREVIDQLKKKGGREVKSIESMLKSFTVETQTAIVEIAAPEKTETEVKKSLKKAFDLDEQHFDGETLYIDRAGLVIAAPFLPSLFERLGYLNEREFISNEIRFRAVHVIEFLATGLQNVEEYNLVLQKLLSGLPVSAPLDPLDFLTETEIEMSESMLYGLMSNWPGFENTSIAGLRETFFWREGMLRKEDDQWELTVQSSGVDVLLDRIPWSFRMIKLPWMKEVLRVEWR